MLTLNSALSKSPKGGAAYEVISFVTSSSSGRSMMGELSFESITH